MSIFIHQSSPIKRPNGRNAEFKKVLRYYSKTKISIKADVFNIFCVIFKI